MQIWEYKYVYLKTTTDSVSLIQRELNKLGEQGWELVNIIGGTGDNSNDATIHGYYFKRPLGK